MAINLSWTAVSGATSYKIYRRSDTTSPAETDLLTTVTAPTVIYADGAGTTAHYYWIRAVNAYGGGALTGPIHKIATSECTVTIDLADIATELITAADALDVKLSTDAAEVGNVVLGNYNRSNIAATSGVITVSLVPNSLITNVTDTYYTFIFKGVGHTIIKAYVPNSGTVEFKDLERVA